MYWLHVCELACQTRECGQQREHAVALLLVHGRLRHRAVRGQGALDRLRAVDLKKKTIKDKKNISQTIKYFFGIYSYHFYSRNRRHVN